ncbi:hypothetical protein DSM21852_02400 [Methylocystis bryophila]|uniref:DUF2946 domain-containing protein n=1 Tax=Methylocystis bryophila TaxID=655015 RepID=A0A1W6MTY6_9HYPH|nr:hypothetical protein B1812_08225 [Methylocystis bryophila]BDV36987.1 hypothetical protein DSM21852_02400 [Methylocystis bryophila]
MHAETGAGIWMRRLLVGLAALFMLVQGARAATELSAHSAFEFGHPAIGGSTSKTNCDAFGGSENSPAHPAGDCLACCLFCSSGPCPTPLVRIPEPVSYDFASLDLASPLKHPDFEELKKLRPDWVSGSGSPRAPPLVF